MALEPDVLKYYDNLEEMFGTPGWRNLVDEMKKRVYELQAEALEAASWELVNQKRGEAMSLAYLTNLEEISDAQREQLEITDEEDALEAEQVDAYV